MDAVQNHFVYPDAAKRYDAHRPFFHPGAIARTRERLGLTAPLPHALDVGCGTGQSAVALRAIATAVTATDVSSAMLAVAPRADGITYVQAPAEALPFAASSFPLITVSMAFHWFDRPRFLAEAARLLQPGGWLVLYGYHDRKDLPGQPSYRTWFDDVFLRRYPHGPRHGEPVSATDLTPHGLTLQGTVEYADTRPFAPAEFAVYLMTHSNVIARVDAGHESAEDAERWLTAEVRRVCGDQPCDYGFDGWVTWVQKTDRASAGQFG